jgi:hypothetical protein
METEQLMLYGETMVVYIETHTKHRLYGYSIAYVSITGLLNAKYTVYIYCVETIWTMC